MARYKTTDTTLRLLVLAAILGSALAATAAWAAPDSAEAERLFAEARTICERDDGRLWGRSLCGPILLVDYTDRAVLANQPDQTGVLKRDGAIFRGVLPDGVIIANTPTEWSGTRWTQLVAPMPTDESKRHVLIAHELFHRIQPLLGLTRPEAGNSHLDTLDGRHLLQLEWRALARALRATTAAQRRSAILDALAFRQERYRIFPAAAADEAALEVAEGVPEYTGVKLGLTNSRDRIAFGVYDLSAFVAAPTFVRSFAYATGPAYGLLLDRADPAWRGKLNSGKRLDQLLGSALKQKEVDDRSIAQRAYRYDDGALHATEVRRDKERQARLAAFRTRLVDGPVLILPLADSNYQFNPQTLVPLDGHGTIYPSMRLLDEWGALEVEHGGALVGKRQATVGAAGIDPSGTSGDGWRLVLNAGWHVQNGERAGDLIVVRGGAEGR